MFSIKCSCGEIYHADEQHAGHKIKCKKCGRIINIQPPDQSISLPRQAAGETHKNQNNIYNGKSQASKTSQTRPKGKHFAWIYACLGAAILLIVWQTIARKPSSRPDLHSVSSTLGTPYAKERPLQLPQQPDCPMGAFLRPISGEELGGHWRGGLGSLRITNGTDKDAVAVLIDDNLGYPRRAIYIRKRESGIMTSIPIGTYRLRFQFGNYWLADRRFCKLFGTSEFYESFRFEERELNNGTEYSTWEVSLHPVPEGTAKTYQIANSSFELPPP
ncbi:MAG: hypothetical protein WCB96_08415 [Candidatus Aminicenantales bacterium]